MHRITLQGPLTPDPNWRAGSYVKLILPDPETGALSFDKADKPKVRTYTARKFDLKEQTVTIDFAIHQPAGPATSWALQAQVGSKVGFMGPGGLKMDPSLGDWYLFAADMAALPAAISLMETLGKNARGYALLEVTDELDKQPLNIPEGIEVQWLLHPHPEQKSQQQLEAIKNLPLFRGQPNVFVAGELSTIREIKSYFLNESDMEAGYLYISSYWKIGLKEEDHKMAKRAILS